jgi:ubiquinone/menaquinone biosynthesis C-methylase UbiE
MHFMSEEPPICDYEGSDYQETFWDSGGRQYEDRVEAIALNRLLPVSGERLLELGAGAGRNTSRYKGFKQIVLLDYSLSQLRLAKAKLGDTEGYTYVAANIYKLPFAPVFDTATMIRTLHHMAKPRLALKQVQQALKPQAVFILEYANKRNIKAILRYLTKRQDWNPFSHEAVEFAELNFDFHPQTIKRYLEENGLKIDRQLTVSHFRIDLLKRIIPLQILVQMDSLAQLTGGLWQYAPSVFIRSRNTKPIIAEETQGLFRCPECGGSYLDISGEIIRCPACLRSWLIRDGIYDFRAPIS